MASKRLFGAYRPGNHRATLYDVSHNRSALERRFPDYNVKEVEETEPGHFRVKRGKDKR